MSGNDPTGLRSGPARQVNRCLLYILMTGMLGLAACGGSSSSSPSAPTPPAQSFSITPSKIADSFTAGTPTPVTVTITPSPALAGTAYFGIGDAAGVISTSVTVSLNADGSYTLTLTPLSSLGPGSHTGQFTVTVCADQACTKPYSGSPLPVPFDFEVAAAPAPVTLNPGSLSGNFVAGDAFPFRLLTTATPAAAIGINLYFQAVDPTGVVTPTVLSVTSGGTLNLALAVKHSLMAGQYTGTVQLEICDDGACATQVPGSPLLVPYDIQVAAAPANGGLTSLAPLNGVPAWEMFQANAAHNGYVPVTLDPSQFATRALQILNDSVSPVAVENGIVYVASPPLLYALREADLGTIWSYDFSALGIVASNFPYSLNVPSVNSGKVYIATSGQQETFMFGFDATAGTLLFQTPFGAQWEHYLAPTVDGGDVFADGGTYGGMYTFDADAGTELNFTALQQFDEWTPAVDATYAYAYIGGQEAGTPAQLNLINRQTGVVVASILDSSYSWSGYSMFSAPVIGAAGSILALNTGNPTNNALLDFDTVGQTIRWSVPGQYLGNPAYHAGVFYAWNGQPLQLEARSETDGTLLWSWSPTANSTIQGRQNDVLLTNNLVFVTTGTATYAIDLTSHQTVWSLGYGGRLAISAQGVLYLSTVDPFNASSGWLASINLH
jgi:PQQ-like domain